MERKRDVSEWKWIVQRKQSLSLIKVKISNVEPLAEALAGNETVKKLWLDDNRIVDIEPLSKALAANSTIEFVSIFKNRIEDISSLTSGLGMNNCLQTLSLRGNQIRNVDAVAAALEQNTTMQTLILSDNHIDDIAQLAAALKKNETLKSLSLSRNKLVNIDCLGATFGDGSCTTLTDLRLDGNDITSIAELLNGLENNRTLQHLDIKQNPIRDKDLLVDFLNKNSTLHMSNLRDVSQVLQKEREYLESLRCNTPHHRGGIVGLTETTEKLYIEHMNRIGSIVT